MAKGTGWYTEVNKLVSSDEAGEKLKFATGLEDPKIRRGCAGDGPASPPATFLAAANTPTLQLEPQVQLLASSLSI